MEASIWRFLLFLGSELVFVIAVLAGVFILGLVILKKRALKSHYIFSGSLISTVLTTVFLILFTRILTGEGHLFIFGVIAVVTFILMLLVELMWLIFGGSDVPWVGRLLWTRYEFEQMAPTSNKILQIVTALALVIYPIYIGIGFFGDAFGGDGWSRYVLRGTLIVLVGLPMLMQIPAMLFVITSRNIMEGTRSRLFMVHLSYSASLIVLLSVFIWTFNSEGATIPILGEYFVFSSTIGYAMGSYLLIILVIPYLIGHRRAKHWMEQLESDWKDLISELTKGLSSLTLKNAAESLDVSEVRVRERLDELRSEKSMELALQVERSNNDLLILQRFALREGIKRDPRFVHLERLLELEDLIKECKTELIKKVQEDEKRELFKLCVGLLTMQKDKEVSVGGSGKAWVLIALTSVATSVANPIVSAVGKFITANLGFSL